MLRKNGKHRRRRRAFLSALGLAFPLGAIALTWRWGGGRRADHATAVATRADLSNTVLALGTLHPGKQVDVGAQVSGQLKTLGVSLGEQVTAGQTVAQIDPTLLAIELRNAQATRDDLHAQREAAVARVGLAKSVLQREQTLLSSEATARKDVDAARAQRKIERAGLASLDAQLRRARAAVETAAANLGYTTITAPIDGTVVAIVTQQGQTVVASQQAPVILKLADLDTMTAKVQVSEADVIHLRPGQPLTFTILGDADTHHAAVLRAIEPAPQDYADATPPGGAAKMSAAVSYNALFDVPNRERAFRVGMTVQVRIVTATVRGALHVPQAAIRSDPAGDAAFVRVLDANGTPVTRPVRLGLKTDIHAQILSGLKEGERVIVGEPGAAADGTLETGHDRG